jgi:hypothetical protein
MEIADEGREAAAPGISLGIYAGEPGYSMQFEKDIT